MVPPTAMAATAPITLKLISIRLFMLLFSDEVCPFGVSLHLRLRPAASGTRPLIIISLLFEAKPRTYCRLTNYGKGRLCNGFLLEPYPENFSGRSPKLFIVRGMAQVRLQVWTLTLLNIPHSEFNGVNKKAQTPLFYNKKAGFGFFE